MAAEGILVVWGLETFLPGHVVLPSLTIALAGLDLYGMHALLMPYYTGLTDHRDGSVPPEILVTLPAFAGSSSAPPRTSSGVAGRARIEQWVDLISGISVGVVVIQFIQSARDGKARSIPKCPAGLRLAGRA